MKHAILYFLASLGLTLAPWLTHAATIELSEISDGAQDITAMVPGEDVPTGVTVHFFSGAIGAQYTATFVVTPDEGEELQCPAVVITVGADVQEDWTCDGTTGEISVTVEQVEFLSDAPEGTEIFVIAFVMPVDDLSQDGPPVEAQGMWLSTNVNDWEMLPPSEASPQFGFILSGPAGTEGFFHMFLPQAIIDLMGNMSGHAIPIENLAVYVDDDQASLNVSEVDGGVLIDINVTFEEDTTLVSEGMSVTNVLAQSSPSQVTKKITAGEKLSVSLAATKYSVKKNKRTTLFGWLKNKKNGKKVTLYQKTGKKKFTAVASMKTQEDGYYAFNVAPSKNTTYKVKHQKKFSPTKNIAVR